VFAKNKLEVKMSATQEWIKEQFAKDHVPTVTPRMLQQQIEALTQRVKAVEEELAWKQKEGAQ
jgi:hypothetical protein